MLFVQNLKILFKLSLTACKTLPGFKEEKISRPLPSPLAPPFYSKFKLLIVMIFTHCKEEQDIFPICSMPIYIQTTKGFATSKLKPKAISICIIR